MTGGGTDPGYPVEPCPLCARLIIWAKDDRAAWVPVDAEPSSAGTHVVRPGHDGAPRAVKPSAKLAFGVRLRQVHYQTCRKGDQLRKNGRPHVV